MQQKTQEPRANNQQQGYNQKSPPQEIYIPPRKKHTLLSIGLILIVLFGAVGLYFAIKPKLTNVLDNTQRNTAFNAAPEVQSATPTPRVEITALKLCDAVDENFVCTENTQRVFKRGDTFYVYAEVIANSKDNGDGPKIRLSDEVKIIYNDGKVLFEAKSESIIKETNEQKEYLLPLIITQIQTDDTDKIGKRNLVLIITEDNLNKKTIKNLEYELT
jgi:hypothetical protein